MGAEPATLSLQDFLHAARRGRIELRPPRKATWLPFKKAPTPGPRPGAASAPPPPPPPREAPPRALGVGGLPATCPLPVPHTKRDRWGPRPRAPTPAPRHGDRPQLACPGRLRLPSMHFQAPAISELQPRGQSGRKKQEVWDCPSRGAGSPKQAGPALGATSPFPAPNRWRTSLGSVSGAGLSSKNPDVFVGHSGTFPGFPSL